MPYNDGAKNVMLDALGAVITHFSLHSSIPDATGSNEISGGSPAYARKSAGAWVSAASGSMAKNAADPVFDVPASTVMFVGFWTALTAGNFRGYAPINGGSVKGVGTAATSDTITSNGHGLVDTDRVTLQAVFGEALPTGLGATTVYYVISSATNTFQLSLTSGGAAVDITAVGELAFQKVIPEVFGSQGTLTLDTLTLDLNG
jgi:hypothetical protein